MPILAQKRGRRRSPPIGVLRERVHRLERALNNMSQGLCMFDEAERLIACNDRYIQMYRLSRKDVDLGCTLRDLLRHRIAAGTFASDPDTYRGELLAAIAEGKTTNRIVESPDGRTIAVVNEPMAGGGWVATHEDITERRANERELDRTRKFLDMVIENVPVTVLVKDARDHRYVLINRAGEDFFGVSRQEMIGKSVYDFLPKADADPVAARDKAVLQSGNQLIIEDQPIKTPRNGLRMVTTKRLAVLGDDGEAQYLLSVLEDVTERRRAEERIAYMAHHDALTNLPNRAAFNEHLADTLNRARAAQASFALLCLDLDRFKEVNDVFGHAVGDGLLREVSNRLRATADGIFLARLGGDEFTMVAEGPQPLTAEDLAERIRSVLADTIEIDGHRLRIGVSVGIAIFPADGLDATGLLANADAALYRAKADGRNSIRFFEAEMDMRLRQRRALQHDLRVAVDRDELVLYYQPQARIGRDIIGFEALVRWQHPTRGLLSPAAFIPLAEENGLIIPIGEWILRTACREAASWPVPMQIAINLSSIQFSHGDLPALMHQILLETGIAPKRVELEITESVLVGDFTRAVTILRRLKALGLRIAMDDFGTGYSSLSYLQSFPFDKIKIDRAFITNLDRNAQAAAIVRAVIGLGRGLDLPVVAEGVETEEQLAFLSRESCDEVQGYLLGRPLPIADYATLIGRVGKEPELSRKAG